MVDERGKPHLVDSRGGDGWVSNDGISDYSHMLAEDRGVFSEVVILFESSHRLDEQ